MNKTVAVVIPIYTNLLSDSELISLDRAFKVFAENEIHIVCPQNFALTNVIFENKKYNQVFFDAAYFTSISGYNSLMLSSIFYEKFLAYDYILIYQTDCYVFKNDLLHWTNKDLDYVGAPWFFESFFGKAALHKKFLGVGNGGFSLRNVQKHFDVLNSPKKIKFNHNTFLIKQRSKHLFFLKGIWDSIQYSFKDFFIVKKRDAAQYIKTSGIIEDVFWGIVASQYDHNFRVASIPVAIHFCFEKNPEDLFLLNKKELPFGAHAWERYGVTFYKPFLEKDGYIIS